MKSYYAYFFVSAVITVYFASSAAGAGCLDTKKCCPGKNNSCFVQLTGPGPIPGKLKRCFCDSSCVLMKDCCADYSQSCKAVNCEVSAYSEWGECDNPCGVGVQVRRRHVLVYSENGGQRCPRLKERRGCMGDHKICLQRQITEGGREREKREISRILPARYGHYRIQEQYDPAKDPLRKNLVLNRPDHDINELLPRPTYCSHFEVTQWNHACHQERSWASTLRPGTRVCLECQPIAMFKSLGHRCKGHGVLGAVTQWNAIGIHGCRGEWRMTTKHETCTCDANGNTDFILL